MSNYRLKAGVALYILGLPQLDSSICRCSDKHIKLPIIHFSVNYLSDFTFVWVRTIYRYNFNLLVFEENAFTIDTFGFEVLELAVGKAQKDNLFLQIIKVGAHLDIFRTCLACLS